MKEIRNENKVSKLVFDPKVARAMCKKGFPIIDIKPLRGEPDKTVFVFANTDEFQDVFVQVMEEMKAKKAKDTEAAQISLDI